VGRYYWRKKPTAEESCDLTIYQLKKWNMLTGQSETVVEWTRSQSGKKTRVLLAAYITNEPFVLLVYSLTGREGKKTDYNQQSLLTTPCNYGGVRYWFACPSCYRRVGALYLARGDIYFRCRHCNNLTYWSRNRCRMEAFGHTSRQIDKLRSQIKRWTWRGRPTRKVRRLQALERKAGVLGGYAMAQIDRLKARLR